MYLQAHLQYKNQQPFKANYCKFACFSPIEKKDQKITLKTCREAQISTFSEGHEQYMHSEQLELLALTWLSNNFDSVCELNSMS